MTSWKALQPRSAVSEETGFKSQRMVALLLKEFKSGPTSEVSWIHIDLRTGSQFSRGSQVQLLSSVTRSNEPRLTQAEC
ncbi:hypothetical protein OJAV_G00155520 [Oryzias javanicus]|uniref:Uncharacterized protein n=1 Tax=Oryzias javanicus TaxID=123683 RepID=A0A3S2LVT0_ORYJA|nr:hypothetical protein OJAV_G00155520 [Oryzias javanicus]